MHKYRSTNVFALLLVTLIAAAVTFMLLRKINSEALDQISATIAPLSHQQSVQSDTPILKFNALIAQGWKVYRNEDMNIEFAYPSDWIIEEESNKDVSVLPKKFQENNTLSNLYFYVSYQKDSNKENLSLDEWVSENIDNRNSITNKNITIDGSSALYTISYPGKAETLYNDTNYFNHIFINVLKNTDEYDISGEKLPNTPNESLTPTDIAAAEQYQSDFDDILASFHFVK